MENKIYEKDGNLVIEIPYTQIRTSAYEEEEWIGQNIIALIEDNYGGISEQMGFCYRIGMEYAGKPDQWTDYFFKFNGKRKEFQKLCKELKIEIIEVV